MNKIYVLIFVLTSFLYNYELPNGHLLSNEDYITGEDGVIRMYVNVIGHVKSPGIYLVYDEIDCMSIMSYAGGFLPGADLKNVIVYGEDGSKRKIDLKKLYSSKDVKNKELKFKPHDTIYIEQKISSKILMSSNLPSILLSILNIALTLERTK